MQKRTRRFFFYLSLLTFLVLGYLMLFLAFGYRYDFSNGRFKKTGSITIKTNIESEVYINDNFANQTSFFTNSFSKTRLLPKNYIVRLQSPNRQSWQKEISVNGGFLSDFPNIILIPNNFKEQKVASSSLTSVVLTRFNSVNKTPNPIKSPDGKKTAHFSDHEIWVEWLTDASSQPFKKTGDRELITRYRQTIHDVQWFKSSEHLIVWVGNELNFVELDVRGGVNIFQISSLGEPFWYDPDNNIIYKVEKGEVIKISGLE